MTRLRLAFPALALALLLPASGVDAQSLLAGGGLGIPFEAPDARSRALGGAGVGLMGSSVSPVAPTQAVDIRVPTVSFSAQSTWVDVTEGEGGEDFTATRFPSFGVAWPASGIGVLTLTLGGVLDQRWRVEEERFIQFQDRVTQVTDEFVSDGGLSAVRLGLARRIAPSLGVGVSLGRFTGELDRRLTRTFDTAFVEVPIQDFVEDGVWEYSGTTATVGAVVDVADILRASGTVTWNGTLTAEPDGNTEGGGRSFDLPLEVRAGATGVLAPNLSLVVGLSWADWSGVDDALEGLASSGQALTVGGGLEWAGGSVLGRQAALRAGYRRSELPFKLGTGDPVETSWSGGLGLVLARAGEVTLAGLDLAVERGSRSSGPVAEDFWRSTLSLRVSGF